MIYMKHPEHGNKHFPDAQQAELEAAGWVRWPRTAEQKAGAVVETKTYADGTVATGVVPLPAESPVARKKPGPKPKG